MLKVIEEGPQSFLAMHPVYTYGETIVAFSDLMPLNIPSFLAVFRLYYINAGRHMEICFQPLLGQVTAASFKVLKSV